jgi:5-methylcytosine-specific restriction endonuclease McrA
LTIARLDHTPENCARDNLRALCQKCHNTYDAKHRAQTRKRHSAVGQYDLFEGENKNG